MRAIACLLLALIALTGARPACATSADPPPRAAAGPHGACSEADRPADHPVCVTASCLGCALPAWPTAFPEPPIATEGTRPAIVPAARLVGLGPLAAIPPPRPLP